MASGMSSSTGGQGRAAGIIVGRKAGPWGSGEPSASHLSKKASLRRRKWEFLVVEPFLVRLERC